jgi:uncharacterized protein (DUF4415 family)
MRRGNPEPLPPELQAELEALAAQPDSAIDRTDPECLPTNQSDWKGAVRGAFYRVIPVKKPIAIRLDADVLAWFKEGGDGYQTRINAALREYMARHQD